MSLSGVSPIYYVCLHYILIMIASGRIVQSRDCYKGETHSKLDFLICGTNIFLQIPVPYVFCRDRFFFFFFFNWRSSLSVFNSCAIFVVRLTKNDGIIQFIKHTWGFLTDNFSCKHCNFQSSMFLSSFLEKRCVSAWEEFSRQVLETAALD